MKRHSPKTGPETRKTRHGSTFSRISSVSRISLELRDPKAYFENADSLAAKVLQLGMWIENTAPRLNRHPRVNLSGEPVSGFWLNTYQAEQSAKEILSLVQEGIVSYEADAS